MEIITKHCRKLIMDLFLKYPAWGILRSLVLGVVASLLFYQFD